MYANINQIIKNKFVITLGILAIFISITRLYYFTIAPTGNGFYSPNYLLSVFIMLFVFIAIIYFSSIEHLPFKKVLSAIGRNSMGIMLIHVLLCHSVAVVLNRLFEINSWGWICLFLMSYVFIVIVSYYLSTFVYMFCPILFGRNKRNNRTTVL